MTNNAYNKLKGYAKAFALVVACSLPSVLAVNYVDSRLSSQEEHQTNRLEAINEAMKNIQSVESRSVEAAQSRASIVELRINTDVGQKLNEVNRRLLSLESNSKHQGSK